MKRIIESRQSMDERRYHVTEVEGRYIRQASAFDHYAIVKIQIYTINVEEVMFENHCTSEQLPTKFADAVEKSVFYYAMQSGITGILVYLTGAEWRKNDSLEGDFSIATLKALRKALPPVKTVRFDV